MIMIRYLVRSWIWKKHWIINARNLTNANTQKIFPQCLLSNVAYALPFQIKTIMPVYPVFFLNRFQYSVLRKTSMCNYKYGIHFGSHSPVLRHLMLNIGPLIRILMRTRCRQSTWLWRYYTLHRFVAIAKERVYEGWGLYRFSVRTITKYQIILQF